MNWQQLTQSTQLSDLLEASHRHPVMIYKHSTRCSISAAALDRLERKWDTTAMEHVHAYFLDLIKYREVSNQIAKELRVQHESPQVIVLRDGKVIHAASHFGIDYDEVKASAAVPA